MALETYDELVQSIKNFMARDDSGEMIPDMIKLCEGTLNNVSDFRLRRMVRSMAIAGADTVVYLPEDYLGIKKLMSARGVISQVTPETLPGVCDDEAVFVEMGEWIEVHNNREEMVLYYYAMIPPISPMRETNWLLKLSPNIYLYGALLEGTQWMKNDERLEVWATRYGQAVSDVIDSDRTDKWAGSIPQVRIVK